MIIAIIYLRTWWLQPGLSSEQLIAEAGRLDGSSNPVVGWWVRPPVTLKKWQIPIFIQSHFCCNLFGCFVTICVETGPMLSLAQYSTIHNILKSTAAESWTSRWMNFWKQTAVCVSLYVSLCVCISGFSPLCLAGWRAAGVSSQLDLDWWWPQLLPDITRRALCSPVKRSAYTNTQIHKDTNTQKTQRHKYTKDTKT